MTAREAFMALFVNDAYITRDRIAAHLDRIEHEARQAERERMAQAVERGEWDGVFRPALDQAFAEGKAAGIASQAEVIDRLKWALRVASHTPHDQNGEPVEGFPACSVCGAIQTAVPA